MTMPTLYWREGSGSMVADAALRLAGIEATRVRVDKASGFHQSAAFLAINPLGQVPTLVLADGTVVTESAAILLVLDEMRPGAGLLQPRDTPARIKALRWLMFMATTLYPAALRAYHPARYTSDPDEAAARAVAASAEAEMQAGVALLGEAFDGPFLTGGAMTIVDVYAAMIADWHPPAAAMPVFRRLRDAMLENAAVAAAWRTHEFG